MELNLVNSLFKYFFKRRCVVSLSCLSQLWNLRKNFHFSTSSSICVESTESGVSSAWHYHARCVHTSMFTCFALAKVATKLPFCLGYRYPKTLFVLTWDMHLVEYELIVTHNESDDKVSQVSLRFLFSHPFVLFICVKCRSSLENRSSRGPPSTWLVNTVILGLIWASLRDGPLAKCCRRFLWWKGIRTPNNLTLFGEGIATVLVTLE